MNDMVTNIGAAVLVGLSFASLAAFVVFAGWLMVCFAHWQVQPLDWHAFRWFVGGVFTVFAACAFVGLSRGG